MIRYSTCCCGSANRVQERKEGTIDRWTGKNHGPAFHCAFNRQAKILSPKAASQPAWPQSLAQRSNAVESIIPAKR
jgi:hypothetical protein